MTLDDVYFFLTNSYHKINSNYDIRNDIINHHRIINDNVDLVWKNGEYVAIVNNIEYKSLRELVLNTRNKISPNVFLDHYYNINEIVENNDLNKFLEVVELSNGILYLYDIYEKLFIYYHTDDKNIYEIIKSAVQCEVPFRFFHENKYGDEFVIYTNNINNIYTLYNPFNRINDVDIENIKRFKIMNNI